MPAQPVSSVLSGSKHEFALESRMIGPLYFFVRNWGGRHVVHPFKKKFK